MSNVIVAENQQAGTYSWYPGSFSSSVAAYTDATSYNPNDIVTFFVSVSAASSWVLTIYRLGWYGGTGARLVHTSVKTTGVQQGYYDGANLQNAGGVTTDGTTHAIDAHWSSSYTWTVPSNAVTGVYLAQFNSTLGTAGYTYFVVKGNATADFIWPLADTSSQAYNNWGTYDLYSTPQATKVTFNRPYYNGYGTGKLFAVPNVNMIRFLERFGYNVSYCSNLDVHTGAVNLSSFNAALSVGHDEYWSYEMRAAWEAALASGVGIGYFGGNGCYWQVRFEADSNSVANRVMVGYKVITGGTGGPGINAPSTDPQYNNNSFFGGTNTHVCSLWADPILNRDEATLLGLGYAGTLPTDGYGWTVDANPDTTYLTNTGLVAGQTYGLDSVWTEFDHVTANTPAGFHKIASTAVFNQATSQNDTQNSGWYRASSGALVFAAGAIGWCYALDAIRHPSGSKAIPVEVPQMQQFTMNVLNALKATKGGDAVTRALPRMSVRSGGTP